jgi:hypothetical protein
MAKRGQLTDAIKAKTRVLLGYEITQRELRLMPYIQSLIMNGQNIDPRKINADERTILSDWRQKGFIEGGASDLAISKDFWDALHEILWIGYVDIEDELAPEAEPAQTQAQ